MIICDNCESKNASTKSGILNYEQVRVQNYRVCYKLENSNTTIINKKYDLCDKCAKLLETDLENWLKTNSFHPKVAQ